MKSTYKNWFDALTDLRTYYSLFPKFPVTDVKKKWDSLACYVYRFLLKHNAKVMCVMVHVADKKDTKVAVKWHPLMAECPESQVYFWPGSSSPQSVDRKIIHPILESMGMQVTSCPTGVMECFNCVIGQLNSKQSEEQSIASSDLAMPTVTAPAEEWKKFLSVSPSSVFEYYTKYSSLSSARNTRPRPISETVFKSADNFETFVKFLLDISISPEKAAPSSATSVSSYGVAQSVTTQRAKMSSAYQSHVTVPSTPRKFPSPPFPHYLLLTADGYLRQFEDSKVFNCKQEHFRLFPEHLDKFLSPILRKLRLESSYFIQPAAVNELGDEPDDENKARVLKLIDDIFADSFPQAMHNAHVVLNASATFPQEELKKYWSMFREDRVFAHFLPDFLKHWALLLTTDDRLYSYNSNIIPVYKHFHEEERGIVSNELARAVMESLKMPFLDISVVVVASVNCPCLSNRDQVLSNMFHLNAQTPLLDAITTERINFLIDYFSVNTKPSDSKWVMHIKSLPFFEDVAGNYKSLSEYSKAFVWPYTASNVGYDNWITRDVVFLKEDAKWNKLGSASQLSIEAISAERVYIDYIFPYFGKMSEDERYQQLEHIRTRFTSIKYYSTLKKRDGMDESSKKRIDDSKVFIRDLKALKCIGPDNSTLQPVRYFCDPKVDIFHVFPSKFHILPGSFSTKEWRDFFKELGLTTKLTTFEFLELCRETAESDEVDKECIEKSDTLLKYMFKTEVQKEWCGEDWFLLQVSNIPFIHALGNSSVEWIAPPAYKARQLLKLNVSTVTSVRNLLWTVRPIITFPSSCFHFPPYGNALQMLLTLKVAFERVNFTVTDVVNNIQNISRLSLYASDGLFDNFPAAMEPADDIKTSLLEILLSDFQFLRHEASVVQPLSDCRCIPVYCDLLDKQKEKMALVKPSRVLFSKQEVEDLHPYLHEAPAELRNYMTVLEAIGVKQTIDGQHIQIVLEALHNKYRESPLDPNAKESVKKILLKLQTLLQHTTPSGDLVSQLSPLYLPDVGDVLKHSTTMLYGDIPAFYREMNLDLAGTPYAYCHTNKSQYGMDASHLCRLLPPAVKPLPLSSKCRFGVCYECKELDEPSELSHSVQKSMKFEENPLGVCELVEKLIPATVSDDHELLESVKFFSSFQIKTIASLETTIILKDCGKPIGREKSEFFISEDGNFVLYIDSEFDDKDEIFKDIVNHLYKILPSSLTETIQQDIQIELLNRIAKYLKADTPSKKKKVLERMGCEGVTKPAGKFQLDLGEEIPDNYLGHRLDQSPYNIFHANERVGYEEKEGCIKVAQIIYLDNPGAKQLDKIYCIIDSEENAVLKKASLIKLYKFFTTSELSSSDSSEVVKASDSDSDRDSDTDLSEIKDTLLEQLKEAWRLEPSERKTAVRRLYLKWHPDKNLDNLETAQEMFQFLQDQIKLLESEDEDQIEESGETTPRSGGCGGGMSASYSHWDNTARTHRDASSWERGYRRDNPHTTSSFDSARDEPKPEEGRRWVRQAETDFKVLCNIHTAASNIMGYGHVCFMAHQVAEKALKGGVYAMCGARGVSLISHNITCYAYALQTETTEASGLSEHSSPLERHYLDTRYPNRWPTGAPYEHYTSQDADSAKEHAEALLDIIRIIMLRWL